MGNLLASSPDSVKGLRALFLKLASILEAGPRLRTHPCFKRETEGAASLGHVEVANPQNLQELLVASSSPVQSRSLNMDCFPRNLDTHPGGLLLNIFFLQLQVD